MCWNNFHPLFTFGHAHSRQRFPISCRSCCEVQLQLFPCDPEFHRPDVSTAGVRAGGARDRLSISRVITPLEWKKHEQTADDRVSRDTVSSRVYPQPALITFYSPSLSAPLLPGSRAKITLHASACPCNASLLVHRLHAVYNKRNPPSPGLPALPGALNHFLQSKSQAKSTLMWFH